MPFYLYRRTPGERGAFDYTQLRSVSLAGTVNGLVYPFVKRYAPAGAEVFPWHATMRDLLDEGGISSKDHAVIIDLKPKDNVSLFEVTDVWGYSYVEWTPIALRMEELFLEEMPLDPARFKQRFSDTGCSRQPVHEFLYLQGGLAGGDWKWGPVGSVNGALLWPDALDYFIAMLRGC